MSRWPGRCKIVATYLFAVIFFGGQRGCCLSKRFEWSKPDGDTGVLLSSNSREQIDLCWGLISNRFGEKGRVENMLGLSSILNSFKRLQSYS